jgi:hypothetical protein
MKKISIFLAFTSLLFVGLIFGCTTTTTEHTYEEQITNNDFEDNTITEEKEIEEVIELTEVSVESAKEWYPTAKEEAKDWYSDAMLYEISGTNEIYGTRDDLYEADGRTDTWNYYFVSMSGLERLKVTVRYGEVVETTNPNVYVNVNNYYTLPSDVEWEIDSYSAINTVNSGSEGTVFLTNDPNPLAKYRLKFDASEEEIVWTITYNSQVFGETLTQHVNAVTNSLM